MSYTVNEIGTLTIETGGGFAGDWASGWSSSNYYHITDLDTAGSAQLHGFVLFYKGTQTDTASGGTVAIPLWGDKDNTGGLSFGVDNGVVSIGDGTTIHRGSTAVNDDAWHSIIFSYGETTVKAYVDGTLEVDITPSSSVMTTSIINAIGHAAGSVTGPAGIDGIQIYDRYLFDFMVADFEANIYAAENTPDIDTFLSGRSDVLTFVDARNWDGSGNIPDNILSADWTQSGTSKVTQDNIEALNMDGGVLSNTSTSTLGATHTYVFFIKWRATNTGWRTGYRGSTDHMFIVQDGTTNLGNYSNSNGSFRDSGYNISPDQWTSLIITSQASSGTVGTTTFYIDGISVGTTDRVKTGDFSSLGYSGQGPGKIAFAGIFDTILTSEEITELDGIMQYYIANGFTSSSSSSSSATFILENLITSNQKTHTLENYKPVNTDFVPIAVQTNDTMAIMEAQLGNTTLEDDIIFTKVYMNHNLDNEEDKLAHRVHVVVPFGFLQLVREKWS